MSLHLLQTKLKYGLMSKKDMEKLQEEYNSYSDSERYMIRSLLNSRQACFEAKNARLSNKETRKVFKSEDKFKFTFNKLDAGLALGSIAGCVLTWGAYALGATALAPVLAGATIALAGVAIANEISCYLKARKGKYDLDKVFKLCKHPIKSFRKKLWAKKTSKVQKIMEIINNAENTKADVQPAQTQKADETITQIANSEKTSQPAEECCSASLC